MKPGTNAMKVSAQRAKSGKVSSARSCIQERARYTLNVVQAAAMTSANNELDSDRQIEASPVPCRL